MDFKSMSISTKGAGTSFNGFEEYEYFNKKRTGTSFNGFEEYEYFYKKGKVLLSYNGM